MLINYSLSNFRSFHSEAELSMKATAKTELSENLIRVNDMRILPSAVIYGANAGGKSNVIMSLALLKTIILTGSLKNLPQGIDRLELYPFLHNESLANEPIAFDITFENNDQIFRYILEIRVGSIEKNSERKITREELYLCVSNKQRNIFIRDEKNVHINNERKNLTLLDFDKALLKEFEKKINHSLSPTEIFLSNAFKNSISAAVANSVIDWFENKLMVVSDFLLKRLNVSFTGENVPDRNFFTWNKVLDVFVKNADFGPQRILYKTDKTEDGTLDTKLMAIYQKKDKDLMIPAELTESRGTLKLLDFAVPFSILFEKGGVFVLDEFDSAIHPELIRGIIALFNNQDANKKNAQLIFTTHNPIYLSNKMFRRDQIMFVEKDRDTFESSIHTLADFGSIDVRNDQNYMLNYFKGRYGALPFIDFAKVLTEKNQEGD